jgi:hypothetical protein
MLIKEVVDFLKIVVLYKIYSQKKFWELNYGQILYNIDMSLDA